MWDLTHFVNADMKTFTATVRSIKTCLEYRNKHEPCQEKTFLGYLTRSDTIWAVQGQKMTRGFKFWI